MMGGILIIVSSYLFFFKTTQQLCVDNVMFLFFILFHLTIYTDEHTSETS